MIKYICIPTIFSNCLIVRVNAEEKMHNGKMQYYIPFGRSQINQMNYIHENINLSRFKDPSLCFNSAEEAKVYAKELMEKIRKEKASKLESKLNEIQSKINKLRNEPGSYRLLNVARDI